MATESERRFTVALAGNPNCGKTTLFNALTGARQRVGNWPGVTVEYVEGFYRQGDAEVRVIDLPGIYSFSARAQDEKIAREYILMQKPDLVVNIVDGSNLERNLYLTTQLIEMRAPVIVALNMMDLVRRRGIALDVAHLERHLGCRVVPIAAARREGLPELRDAIAEYAPAPSVAGTRVSYDAEVEESIALLAERGAARAAAAGVDARWMAIKLLEGDPLAAALSHGELGETVETETHRIERHTGDSIVIVMADGRYGFVHGLARDVIHRSGPMRHTLSDAIDRVALNRVLGLPIFLGVMGLVFFATVHLGGPFIDFFDKLLQTLAVDCPRFLLEKVNAPGALTVVLADGLGEGIRMVATLIPPIFFIFVCLSILEDSGYMARAAFIMDHWLRRVGLPGKAFLPLLVGFGCNVPAILAARTLDDEKDRLVTVLINPFMSCGARFPVYALFAVAFFPHHGTAVIFALYFTGVGLALATAWMLRSTLLRGPASTFVMELPPYHVPTLGGIMHHTWHRLSGFILRAGKVILVFVTGLSLLGAVGTDGRFGGVPAGDSVLAAVGRRLTPVFRPMGIGDSNWPAVVGLFSGVFAKEAVVGTLGALYGQTETRRAVKVEAGESFRLGERLREAWRAIPRGLFISQRRMGDDPRNSPGGVVSKHAFGAMRECFGGRASAFAYLLFVLIYVPCVATIAAIYREAGAGWAVFAVAYLTGLAWIVATAFYQAATFIAHPFSSTGWLAVCAAVAALFYTAMAAYSRRAGEAR